MTSKKVFQYSEAEEKANALTHFFGVLFALYVIFDLVWSAYPFGAKAVLSYGAFGLSLFLMYLSSTYYHLEKNETRKLMLKKCDHMAIFILIAGTFTPFLMFNIATPKSIWFCAFFWLYALGGVLFKLFGKKERRKLSLFIYLAMGWSALFMWSDLKEVLPQKSVDYILFGGLSYTVGSVFYMMKRIRYTHMVWHLFVMGGTTMHYLAIVVAFPK
ncbi:MAG: hypothetical protein CME70_09705 [Halobacteriovorax sp.]|nr:hypothetical protein [Halobacteriovorax sp.]|tara:strand:+ start:128578 stop:129222 length:645 start_codon:yes stop_codon:yes gene_type:complete